MGPQNRDKPNGRKKQQKYLMAKSDRVEKRGGMDAKKGKGRPGPPKTRTPSRPPPPKKQMKPDYSDSENSSDAESDVSAPSPAAPPKPIPPKQRKPKSFITDPSKLLALADSIVSTQSISENQKLEKLKSKKAWLDDQEAREARKKAVQEGKVKKAIEEIKAKTLEKKKRRKEKLKHGKDSDNGRSGNEKIASSPTEGFVTAPTSPWPPSAKKDNAKKAGGLKKPSGDSTPRPKTSEGRDGKDSGKKKEKKRVSFSKARIMT